MQSELLITPGFSMQGGQNQITFPANSVNHLQTAEYLDSWDWYQQTYGLYAFMKLTKRYEYNLHTISGSPLIWQPFSTCEFSPGNNIRSKKTTFTPDRVKLNERMCHDDLFNSCFEQMLTYGNGPVELDAEGTRMINMILEEIMYQSMVSARALLSTGGLYDLDAAGFDFEGTPADRIALLKLVYSSTSGWLTGFRDLAADGVAPHLNIAGVFNPANITAANYTATGGFRAIYDAVKAGAPKALQQLINNGPGVTNKGRRIGAVVVVSPTVYTWVVNTEIAEGAAVAQNKMRMAKTQINANTQGAPTFVYSIDGVPIVCANEIGTFDQYMAGDTYSCHIIASGNIQLGISFDSLNSNTNIGILVEQSQRAHDYGTTYFLAHGLFKAVLADHNLAAGSFVRHEL